MPKHRRGAIFEQAVCKTLLCLGLLAQCSHRSVRLLEFLSLVQVDMCPIFVQVEGSAVAILGLLAHHRGNASFQMHAHVIDLLSSCQG